MIAEQLAVSNLSVAYRQGPRWMRVVDEVTFAVTKGEVFGLVGESGCGKSTVALQLLGFRHPAMRTEGGAVLFEGNDLTRLLRPKLDELRGDRISYVPQNPTTALNPGIRIGNQIAEVLEAHPKALRVDDAAERVARLLPMVGLPGNRDFQRRYPHQLSGGQQQRVCIAMALACDPELVVLDEPTTGLDVTTQEQIISLLIDLRSRLSMSMLYVTHDLGLLAQIADRVAVMYAGRIVEVAPTAELFASPRHPYTRGLIGSIPRIDDSSGSPPRPMRGFLQRHSLPPGCPFSPRCDFAQQACIDNPQILEPAGKNRTVACRRWRDIGNPDAVRRAPAVVRRTAAQRLLSLDHVSIRYGKESRRPFATFRSRSPKARPLRSSGNRAAANPPSPGRSAASCRRRKEPSRLRSVAAAGSAQGKDPGAEKGHPVHIPESRCLAQSAHPHRRHSGTADRILLRPTRRRGTGRHGSGARRCPP